MDFIEQLGTLALGTRIKNLGELLMKDMARVYRDQGVEFEPRWFTFFQLILKKKEVSVTEIAHDLRQTHPAVVQVVNTLEKKGLVSTRKDKDDHRKRLVSLSRKGKEMSKRLQALWSIVQETANEILNESDPDFLHHMASLEKAIGNQGVYQRISEKLASGAEPLIVECEEKHFPIFRKLNEDWLNNYLEVSEYDRMVLADPQGEIIDDGGKIYCMLMDGDMVGTYALKPLNSGNCELSKFTIKKEYRGRRLGHKLLRHAREEALKMDCKNLVLFTHHKLVEATALYRKAGFIEIEEHEGMTDPTGRCSLLMKLSINTK